jgi:hypothetical protein
MSVRAIMIVTALVGVAGVLVVEGFALGNSIDGDTLSEIVADAGDLTSAMPFALGALVGHFVSRRQVDLPSWLRLTMGLSLVPVAVAMHFIDLPAMVSAPVGMAAGWLMWPLKE